MNWRTQIALSKKIRKKGKNAAGEKTFVLCFQKSWNNLAAADVAFLIDFLTRLHFMQ